MCKELIYVIDGTGTLNKKDENGFKEYIGNLKDINDKDLIIEQGIKDYVIERKKIAQIVTICVME